jgi:hypothetical protein
MYNFVDQSYLSHQRSARAELMQNDDKKDKKVGRGINYDLTLTIKPEKIEADNHLI